MDEGSARERGARAAEHGVGQTKRGYMGGQFDADAIGLMRAAVDPPGHHESRRDPLLT